MTLRKQAVARFSHWNRRRKADFARQYIRDHNIGSVLLVGVASSRSPGGSYLNLVEKAICDACPRVVASGLGDEAAGWDEYVQADALDLPFPDGAFDLVYSNAVIEHVGQKVEQQLFVDEHARVGKRWILTTPNRLFPVESHRAVLFKHMSRSWRDERGYVTRLLSPADLAELLPAGGRISGSILSPTITAFRA